MIALLLLIGWLFLLISGIAIFLASKYRKTGITLIILFLAPPSLLAYGISQLDESACLLDCFEYRI